MQLYATIQHLVRGGNDLGDLLPALQQLQAHTMSTCTVPECAPQSAILLLSMTFKIGGQTVNVCICLPQTTLPSCNSQADIVCALWCCDTPCTAACTGTTGVSPRTHTVSLVIPSSQAGPSVKAQHSFAGHRAHIRRWTCDAIYVAD